MANGQEAQSQLAQAPKGWMLLMVLGPGLMWCGEYIGSGEVILSTRSGAIFDRNGGVSRAGAAPKGHQKGLEAPEKATKMGQKSSERRCIQGGARRDQVQSSERNSFRVLLVGF